MALTSWRPGIRTRLPKMRPTELVVLLALEGYPLPVCYGRHQ